MGFADSKIKYQGLRQIMYRNMLQVYANECTYVCYVGHVRKNAPKQDATRDAMTWKGIMFFVMLVCVF